MTRFTKHRGWRKFVSRMTLLRVILSLFSVSQLLPAGASFAQGGDGFALVMCTPDGVKTLSWVEATGEPSPFDAPTEDHSSKSPCHACASGSCSGGVAKALTYIPNAMLLQPSLINVADVPVFVRSNAGPPLPSRAPPAV
ncbi:hypothetical protein ACFOOP_13805 [Marinicaulis aureus]|uniref:DUF2946 domain-containing protein n=1 Tax=Hyphococcus aureus TaxID=2666033 RepID=A0ABW1L2I7_9PROT